MAIETSSIDDVLATAHLPSDDSEPEVSETPDSPEPKPEISEPENTPEDAPEEKQDEPEEDKEYDDYGNEQPKQESKTYTEDEVNERINKAVRERLARLEKNQPQAQQQPTQQQQQQAADAGFQYDENSNQDWQQQLKQFIRQTNEEVQRETQQQQLQQQEQQAQAEFEGKFHQGMGKFRDFREVVGAQPITDAMTVATRSMKDPAAFMYAASKNHASELQRISQLDPYAQMVEVGRLEERMRKARTTSKAPRPLSQTREDSTVREPSQKTPSIEDLMQQADARKLKNMRSRRS